MGPHTNLERWGFWVGIVALLLTFPLSVFANIVTPKLLNWWAERSAAATKSRIETLEKRLADFEESYPVTSETEETLLEGVESIGIMGVFCLELVAIVILMVVLSTIEMFSSKGMTLIVVSMAALSALSGLFGMWMQSVVFKKITDYREKHCPTERASLRATIEKLKERLSK